MQDRKQLQRQAIRDACAHRGIKVTQRGGAFMLRGPDVDLWTTDLALLDAKDLQPGYVQRRNLI